MAQMDQEIKLTAVYTFRNNGQPLFVPVGIWQPQSNFNLKQEFWMGPSDLQGNTLLMTAADVRKSKPAIYIDGLII